MSWRRISTPKETTTLSIQCQGNNHCRSIDFQDYEGFAQQNAQKDTRLMARNSMVPLPRQWADNEAVIYFISKHIPVQFKKLSQMHFEYATNFIVQIV